MSTTSQFRSIRHIPHSRTDLPEEYRNTFLLSDADLERELLRMTDRYTDEIFGRGGERDLVFPVSRLLVDVERFEDDLREVMSDRGMGVLYTRTHDRRPLRREPEPQEREELLACYYRPHHARLEAMVNADLKSFGQALVIDCHSFPSGRLPYEVATEGDARPEICIGTDPFHTPDRLREAAVEGFECSGFQVDVDTPFSGALVPARHYEADGRVLALMIEVRRDLYMDEETGERLDGFVDVKDILQSVIKKLEEQTNPKHSC